MEDAKNRANMNTETYIKALYDSCESDADFVIYDAVVSDAESQCMGDEGPCNNKGKAYRQNTAYDQKISNWRILCEECIKSNDAYWKERWAEYYNGLL